MGVDMRRYEEEESDLDLCPTKQAPPTDWYV